VVHDKSSFWSAGPGARLLQHSFLTRARCLQELGYDPRGRLSVELDVAAELTGAWTVTAPADPSAGEELLAATAGLHVYGPAFLQARGRQHAVSTRYWSELMCTESGQDSRQPNKIWYEMRTGHRALAGAPRAPALHVQAFLTHSTA
jgi:hypothetical protein